MIEHKVLLDDTYWASNPDYIRSISNISIREDFPETTSEITVFICKTIHPDIWAEYEKHLDDPEYFYNLVKNKKYRYRKKDKKLWENILDLEEIEARIIEGEEE